MCICFNFSHFIFKLTKTKDVFDLVLIGEVFSFIFIMHDPNLLLCFSIYYINNIFYKWSAYVCNLFQLFCFDILFNSQWIHL